MLKKIILATVLVVGSVFAQNIHVGARAAGNIGTAWGENADKFGLEWGPGFTGGVDAKFAISPILSIVTGLEFEYRSLDWNLKKLVSAYADEMSGVSSSEIEMVSQVKFSFGLSYLDIPVLARIYPDPKFFIDAGIYVGFNVSSSLELSYQGLSRTMDTPEQMQKDTDFGLIAGIGYAVMPKVDVYFRYTMGLVDMLDVVKFASVSGNDVDYSDAPNIACKNMRFQLGVSYWFM